jgi:hypothetical protein
VPSQTIQCEEERGLSDWTTVETPLESPYEDDNIFNPDDEIILDPKESMEAPIKRVYIPFILWVNFRRVLVRVLQNGHFPNPQRVFLSHRSVKSNL